MTPTELKAETERLLALDAKRTPGKWSVYEDCLSVAAHGARFVARGTYGEYFTENLFECQSSSTPQCRTQGDAAFIAAAPDMAAQIRRLQAALDEDANEIANLKHDLERAISAAGWLSTELEAARSKT